MTNPRYRSLLRAAYTAILASHLSPTEFRALALELRRGQLPDELAFMLDNVSQHFGGADEVEPSDEGVIEAEELVRGNKVSRSALLSILASLDYSPPSSKATTKTLINTFMLKASISRRLKFLDILRSIDGGDNYLTGISANRK